jgi:N6-L-threonylcarbamoyladenine synthase
VKKKKIEKILEREPELLKQFPALYEIPKPKLDRIAVTSGPGLEPALWVGLNFAKALSVLWDLPVVPTNHMRGHFLAPLAEGSKINFPALGLLISGGHTEIVIAKSPVSYKLLGTTRDDAAGEAYDKTARILGFPYPGGPQIAALAAKARGQKLKAGSAFTLPRPMIHTKEIEFSFSGLKTAVMYMVKKFPELDERAKELIAMEFEESVKDVLVAKTKLALAKTKARPPSLRSGASGQVKTLVIGGGVSANLYIRSAIQKLAKEYGVDFLASSKSLATDNAIMIGVAGYYGKPKPIAKIKAEGNLDLTKS